MKLLATIFKFMAEYFVFLAGSVFIFVVGFLYAYIKPSGILFNVVFLVIFIGWIVFMIRYFWELLEKNKSKRV